MGLLLAVAMLTANKGTVSAFQPVPFVGRRRDRISFLFSSMGDSLQPPPPDDDDDNNSDFGNFLNQKEESEGLRRARDYMSEQSLPPDYTEPFAFAPEDREMLR